MLLTLEYVKEHGDQIQPVQILWPLSQFQRIYGIFCPNRQHFVLFSRKLCSILGIKDTIRSCSFSHCYQRQNYCSTGAFKILTHSFRITKHNYIEFAALFKILLFKICQVHRFAAFSEACQIHKQQVLLQLQHANITNQQISPALRG